MWSRLIRWIARAEIADAQQAAFVDGSSVGYRNGYGRGVAEGYATGYNTANQQMAGRMKEALEELEFVRALFPLYRSSRGESKRVH